LEVENGMYFMLTFEIPPHKAEEVAKAFIKIVQSDLAKLPDYVKQLHALNVMANNIKSYVLWEIDDDKIPEGLGVINKLAAQYMPIEGMKILLEPLITMQDSLAIFGLKMD
jgi:hypothetical protein